MSRVVWLSDIHLNFLSPVKMEQFFSLMRSSHADAFLLSGDIGDAPRLIWYLQRLEARLERPIYFVLGNHDCYNSSFAEVQTTVAEHVALSPNLCWLTQGRVVELSADTGLIGHDGWADGRLGDYAHSELMMNDFFAITDFIGLDKAARLTKLNALGDAAAAFAYEWLPKTLAEYQHIYFLTHVPPFRDACWHEGQISDDNFLPHFTCGALGDALVKIMTAYPSHQLTVLCGHTHSPGQAQILPNLTVLTGEAEYGKPHLQRIFEFA